MEIAVQTYFCTCCKSITLIFPFTALQLLTCWLRDPEPVASRTRASLQKTVEPKKAFASSSLARNVTSAKPKRVTKLGRQSRLQTPRLQPDLRKRQPSGAASKKTLDSKPSTTDKKKKKNALDLTIPKPFNLRTSTLKHAAEPKSPFVSLAAKVKQIVEKTPDRFKTKPVKPKANKRNLSKLTQPQSPFLSTKIRSKNAKHIPSKDELEVAELAKIEKFKAKPVNRKVFFFEIILLFKVLFFFG